ncbi:MAG: hypothetical protein ACLFTA_02090 [Candidatus Nanohaloarchaea archaeon]
MKGLELSLSFVVMVAVGLIVAGIILALLTGNISGLKEFALANMNFSTGGMN